MKSQYLPLIRGLAVEAAGCYTWKIEQYEQLTGSYSGPTFTVAGRPWEILLWPHGNHTHHASCYLQLAVNDQTPRNWHCCAQFALVMWNKYDPTIFIQHSATHRFDSTSSDWGFTRFAELDRLFAPRWDGGRDRPMIELGAVNITAYVRVYNDSTGVLWRDLSNYDSKKETGMVGLKNAGATGYLDALLQSLFFIRAFRQAIYRSRPMGTNPGGMLWALQRLFHRLETSTTIITTNELTQSFGWEAKHSWEPGDIYEMYQVVIKSLRFHTKGTEVENALYHMLAGKITTYISCIDVQSEDTRSEDFWGLELPVYGMKSLEDSFKDYIKVETRNRENQYYSKEHGLQDARVRTSFTSLPPVLHIQLQAYFYDINLDMLEKIHDRFEFPETFDASPYLSKDADQSEPYIYQLYGVWVHDGDVCHGKYYAFLRPKINGCFYKFHDHLVTKATRHEVFEGTFGTDKPSPAPGRVNIGKSSVKAYVLVYLRESRLDRIMEMLDCRAPDHVIEEMAEDAARRETQERLYQTCQIADDHAFQQHQWFDIASWESSTSKSAPDTYRVLKTTTVKELCHKVAAKKRLPNGHVRLWNVCNRQNKTIRVERPLRDDSMIIKEAYRQYGPLSGSFRLWAEFAEVKDGGTPVFESQVGVRSSALLFLKYFDPQFQSLAGIGHIYFRQNDKLFDLLPQIRTMMGWKTDSAPSRLEFFEEFKPSAVAPIALDLSFGRADLQDGDVLCFQKPLAEEEVGALKQAGKCTSAKEFYDSLLKI